MTQEGGCLCGDVRFAVTDKPLRTTHCTCRFCQKMTGTPMNLLAGFQDEAFALVRGAPKVHTHVSAGSGKKMHLNSCPECATTMFVVLERYPGFVGVMAGAFDDPDWFDRTPETSKFIFTDNAMKGTLVRAGFPVYGQHAMQPDGTPCAATVFEHHHMVGE